MDPRQLTFNFVSFKQRTELYKLDEVMDEDTFIEFHKRIGQLSCVEEKISECYYTFSGSQEANDLSVVSKYDHLRPFFNMADDLSDIGVSFPTNILVQITRPYSSDGSSKLHHGLRHYLWVMKGRLLGVFDPGNGILWCS